jgi:Mg-chelatase subunit ChlD
MAWQSPHAGWILLLLPLLIFLMLRAARDRIHITRGFLAALLHASSRRHRFVAEIFLCVAIIASTIGLMGPFRLLPSLSPGTGSQILEEKVTAESEESNRVPLPRLSHDLILLLDCSASMAVTDTRMNQSRLDYAKEIIDEVISRLDGQTVALYAFTSQLATIVPSTLDYLYARLSLRHVGINEGDAAGTDLMEALDAVMRRHAWGGEQRARTLVLLTDGGDTRLEAAAVEERARQIEALCSRLRLPGVPLTVVTIGLGSAAGELIPGILHEGKAVRSSLDDKLLRRLAEIGPGSYYFANDFSSLGLADQVVLRLLLAEAGVEEGLYREAAVERVEEVEAPLGVHRLFRYPLVVALIALTVVAVTRDGGGLKREKATVAARGLG